MVEVGVFYGLINGAFGVIGLLLSGTVAGRLITTDSRWIVWILMLLIASALPFSIAMVLVPGHWAALLCMAIAFVPASSSLALSIAALQMITPPDMRARLSAITLFIHATVGALGPLFVGMISDTLQPTMGEQSLRGALLLVPLVQIIALAVFYVATRYYNAELLEEQERLV